MRRFTRLVFGVNCAPEIFQRVMERILAGIRNVVIFIDDILVFGENQMKLKETMTVREIQDATKNDKILEQVMFALENDVWHDDNVKRFEKMKEELRCRDGVVLRLGAIVMPTELRKKALKLAHEGHPGVSAMKSILRSKVWWPGMPTDAEKYVKGCEGCAWTGGATKPVPMRPTTLPEEPWEKLAIDFNGKHGAVGGKMVVVIVDYFSRFVFAEFIPSTDFASVKPVLDQIFKILGNPRSIRSDNGPPFNGEEWARYCENKGIIHERSTPGFPQQNGLVERYMQIINKAVTIACATNEDPEASLAKTVEAHNMAVQRTTNVAPEVLLLGRRRRSKFPIMDGSSVELSEESLRKRDMNEKHRSTERENQKRGAREPEIQVGDEVFVKRWTKAKDQTKFDQVRFKVLSRNEGDFEIEGSDGRKLTRNITQLKKAPVVSGSDSEESMEMQESIVAPRPKRRRMTPAHLSDYQM
jgi:hypothetical protein